MRPKFCNATLAARSTSSNVGHHRDGFAALLPDLDDRLVEGGGTAGHQRDLGAPLGGHQGRGEPDAAGRPGDDDGLSIQWLQ
jgi:hypothetical protein